MSTDPEKPAEIWVDRDRQSGQPCVWGTRLPVLTLVRYADACGDAAALEAYPWATAEDLAACRAFLAEWKPIHDEDGSRTWAMPELPGPDVKAVRDRRDRTWAPMIQNPRFWGCRETGALLSIVDVLQFCGPLTDVSAEVSSTEEERDGH